MLSHKKAHKAQKIPFVLFVAKSIRDSRDTAVAEHVVWCLEFGDDIRRLKLAQHFRWPHAMCSAFADGCVVDAHEFGG